MFPNTIGTTVVALLFLFGGTSRVTAQWFGEDFDLTDTIETWLETLDSNDTRGVIRQIQIINLIQIQIMNLIK
jgi:hypothetical protein